MDTEPVVFELTGGVVIGLGEGDGLGVETTKGGLMVMATLGYGVG